MNAYDIILSMVENLDIIGNWDVVLDTPFGESKAKAVIKNVGQFVSGTVNGENGSFDFDDGTIADDVLTFSKTVDTPIKATLFITVKINEDKFFGSLLIDEYMKINIKGVKNVNL